MRSAADLRQRWLDVLPRMVTRPGMWATDGRAFDVVARGLIADLCFLDEREQDLDDVHAVLQGYGKLGVAGPFIALFGRGRNCVAEVASVFAEQFHRLGYLPAARLLDAGEWKRLITSIRERFDGRDVRRSEVEASVGSPSLVVEKRVLCYAPADMSGWVFVDCFAEQHDEYVPGAGRYEWRRDDDPLVRAVRRPAGDFESGLTLTLYGKVLRWVRTGGWTTRRVCPTSNRQSPLSSAASSRVIRRRRYGHGGTIDGGWTPAKRTPRECGAANGMMICCRQVAAGGRARLPWRAWFPSL